jgi:hypothetical protein
VGRRARSRQESRERKRPLSQPMTVKKMFPPAKNLNLERSADRWMPSARKRSRESGETAQVYGATHYQAKRWRCKRRVIIKAEVVRHPRREPKENPRFVITSLLLSPRWIYEKVYCGRGEIENRIKELHHGLISIARAAHDSGRTSLESCSRRRPPTAVRETSAQARRRIAEEDPGSPDVAVHQSERELARPWQLGGLGQKLSCLKTVERFFGDQDADAGGVGPSGSAPQGQSVE